MALSPSSSRAAGRSSTTTARSSSAASAASRATSASSARARTGSRSTSVAAALAVSRSEKSFCATASCRSWAMRARSPARVRLAAALVQAGVGEGEGGVRGEYPQQFLVVVGEQAAAALVGEEDDAGDLRFVLGGLGVQDGHAEEGVHLGVGGRPAAEGRGPADVGEPGGAGLVQHLGEDAVLAGQRADRPPLLVGDAVDDELGEAAVVVGHAQSRVLGAEQVAGGGGDAAQHLADLQVPAHREQRLADRLDAGQAGVAAGHRAGRAAQVEVRTGRAPAVAGRAGHTAKLPPPRAPPRRSAAGVGAGPGT